MGPVIEAQIPLGHPNIHNIFLHQFLTNLLLSPSTHSQFSFTGDTPHHRLKIMVSEISRPLEWRCENFTQFHCHKMITPSYGERISPDGARLLVLVGNDFCIRDGARRRNAKVFRNPLRWTCTSRFTGKGSAYRSRLLNERLWRTQT